MNSVFKAGKYNIDFKEKTYIMGILNVTPDSFSDGGKWLNPQKAVEHAIDMVNCGADIIDIGAQSTRPGFVKVSAQEEWSRLEPVIKILRKEIDKPISIDTFYPEVACRALESGIDIINDVTGFQNEDMLSIASKSNCGCIVMHCSNDFEIQTFFKKQIVKFQQHDISLDRICLDPGIGFGKTYEQNLKILKDVRGFTIEGYPVLIGASKKRVIGESCGNPEFNKRMPGTIAAHTMAINNGANIIRVHDVAESVQAARVADAILHS